MTATTHCPEPRRPVQTPQVGELVSRRKEEVVLAEEGACSSPLACPANAPSRNLCVPWCVSGFSKSRISIPWLTHGYSFPVFSVLTEWSTASPKSPSLTRYCSAATAARAPPPPPPLALPPLVAALPSLDAEPHAAATPA